MIPSEGKKKQGDIRCRSSPTFLKPTLSKHHRHGMHLVQKKREHLQARNRIFISRTGHGHIISYSTRNKSLPKQKIHIPNIFIPIISIRFCANHPNPMIHISPAQKSGLREHHAMLLQEVAKATGPQLKWRQKRSNR